MNALRYFGIILAVAAIANAVGVFVDLGWPGYGSDVAFGAGLVLAYQFGAYRKGRHRPRI